MFGWEFPPHIAGGLGTASFGLTRGLAAHRDIEVIFVVPKAYGDEDQSIVRLIGANTVPVAFKKVKYRYFQRPVEKIEVFSKLVPYTDPEEFWKITRGEVADTDVLVRTNEHGKVDFSGTYGPSLMDEIHKYSVVAQVIASEQEFDIIHAHDWLAYPAGIAAKAVFGKPLVILVHVTDYDRSAVDANRVVYGMEKEGMDAADKIITVSNLTRDIVINKYNVDPEKVETVYNAVEPLHHSELDVPKRAYDDKIVTFLGRITMQKGPEYFIEAARMVLSRMPNVRFVMAGSGDMMERMMRHAAALRITDRFHFTGFLRGNDVFTMLRMSDVYVMPSVSEPFGISPLEAMQSNVPVIISKQSGVAEVLTHAVKVDFWDIEAMADAIYGILTYPALSRMFIMNGKEEVDKLKWEKAAGHVKGIYSEVLQQTR